MAGTGAPAAAGMAGMVTLRMALPLAPTVAATPLTVSLLMTLPAVGLPLAPLMPRMVSLPATMGAVATFTVMVVLWQFSGLSFSHSL